MNIQVKQSINLCEDTPAWCALGHHDAQQFLSALSKQHTPRSFSIHQVRYIWAESYLIGFWEVEAPTSEAIAMTVVEDLDRVW